MLDIDYKVNWWDMYIRCRYTLPDSLYCTDHLFYNVNVVFLFYGVMTYDIWKNSTKHFEGFKQNIYIIFLSDICNAYFSLHVWKSLVKHKFFDLICLYMIYCFFAINKQISTLKFPKIHNLLIFNLLFVFLNYSHFSTPYYDVSRQIPLLKWYGIILFIL